MTEWGRGGQFCGHSERDAGSGLLLVICACLTSSLTFLGKTIVTCPVLRAVSSIIRGEGDVRCLKG